MGCNSMLYNSAICRLCGEENENGCFLYCYDENEQNLCELINTFLPIKLENDGRMPRTICPGCNIQLEATMDFIKLIIKGQQILKNMLLKEIKIPDLKLFEEVVKLPDPIESTECIYPPNHPAALQIREQYKPRRKRGRPTKKNKPKEEVVDLEDALPPPEEAVVAVEEELSGKRRRKTPVRFKEAVQGKELERIFIQEGVIDAGDSDIDLKVRPESPVSKVPEVIGHSEVSGELVVVVKGKGRGRPKGSLKNNKDTCVICGLEFSCVGRYMSHVAQHGKVKFQCESCEETVDTRIQFDDHQKDSGHTGLVVLLGDEEVPKKVYKNEKKINQRKLQEQQDIEKNQAKVEELVDDKIQYVKTDEPHIVEETHPESDEIDNDLAINSMQDSPIVNVMDDPLLNNVETRNEQSNEDGIVVLSDNEAGDSGEAPPSKDELPSEEPTPPNAKKRVKCNLCEKTFGSKQSKSVHMKVSHSGERPHKCTECGLSFPYARSLSLHYIKHRRTRGFACDLCGKVLNHPSSVVYHKEAEHGGQSYACGKCGKSFKHKQLLHRHQLVHSQARPFQCGVCDAAFKTNANLINHQSLHTGFKKFSCDICKQRFAHKTSLTLHLRWHTGYKPYACAVCNKTFSQKGNLSEHMRTHTGERPFQCADCSKSFATSSQYKLHLRQHTGERPFACPQCGKRFMSRDSWRNHMRREAGSRAYRCECGRAFADKCALVKHRRQHTGERPFKCPYCLRHFSDGSNRNKHVKQMHKDLLQRKSLLAPIDGKPLPPIEEIDKVTNMQKVTDAELEERVIIVTYDIHNDDASTLHILDPENETVEDNKVFRSLYEESTMLSEGIKTPPITTPEKPALYYEDDNIPDYPEEQEQMTITDEQGNPIHFTMQDGTRLAITSADGGRSLQVVTRDGQTIPVEINNFMNEEEVQSSEAIHELNLQKVLEEESPASQFFSIMQ